ncbi:unnamed protein product, partial [marine sediment metagenome]
MRRSNLIQRLETPWELLNCEINPFSFGGGYKNGGFTEEAMKLLSQVTSFDYMGSAEFEFGKVPKTLAAMLENSREYTLLNIEVNFKASKFGETDVDEGKAPVWIICKGEDADEVEKRIRYYAVTDYNNPPYVTKEMVFLNSALAGHREKLKGWFELDNGYMFFSDKEMFENFAKMLLLMEPDKCPEQKKS